MRSIQLMLSVIVTGTLTMPVFADEPRPADPLGMWECPQTGAVILYTNREREGCRKLELKPVSVVPAMPEFHANHVQPTVPTLDIDHMPQTSSPVPAHSRNVPDWAKGWYANNTSDAPVQTEVCSLYSEWLQLVQRTRGGFFFGNDPSYGSDPSGRNYLPTNPFWDNARYFALARIFGAGFVPIGCL
jgi:hypothetical protein